MRKKGSQWVSSSTAKAIYSKYPVTFEELGMDKKDPGFKGVIELDE